MKALISCAYNMDNCCVELKFNDGSMIAIDTIAVENEIADNMYQRSELDYLIYNDPIAYADQKELKWRRKQERKDRICQTCGTTFTPKRSDAKFCCNACRQKAYRDSVTDNEKCQVDTLA